MWVAVLSAYIAESNTLIAADDYMHQKRTDNQSPFRRLQSSLIDFLITNFYSKDRAVNSYPPTQSTMSIFLHREPGPQIRRRRPPLQEKTGQQASTL